MTRLPLGRCVITPAAITALEEAGLTPASLLERQSSLDFGQLDAHDRHANEVAIRDGLRVLSNYPLPGGQRVWIITEWDRSYTTVLLPSDY